MWRSVGGGPGFGCTVKGSDFVQVEPYRCGLGWVAEYLSAAIASECNLSIPDYNKFCTYKIYSTNLVILLW
jgi:hypothetical protein